MVLNLLLVSQNTGRYAALARIMWYGMVVFLALGPMACCPVGLPALEGFTRSLVVAVAVGLGTWILQPGCVGGLFLVLGQCRAVPLLLGEIDKEGGLLGLRATGRP